MIILFFAISFITVLVASAIIVKAPIRNAYKLFSVFMIFVMLYTGWFYAQSVYGYAYQHQLPNKFQLLWGQEIQQTSIELWINPAQGNGFSHYSRLYTIPWSKKLADELAEAKKSLVQGVPVVMGTAGSSNHKGKSGIAGLLKNAADGLSNNNGAGGENLEFLPDTEQLPQK